MDQQAAVLLATLKKPTASSDVKVNLLNALKSDIKHCRVPENAQGPIFEVLKLAFVQQSSSTLASTAFSTLGHLLKRLKLQDETGYAIKQFAPRLIPSLQERMGDLREPVRAAVSQALCDLYTCLPTDVEAIIRDFALEGTNVRAKESAMRWIVDMHRDQAMPFKTYVGPVVARLEDADGGVRDAAKTTLIELFKDAPDRAKADLKRQLRAYSVRTSIETQIFAQLGPIETSKASIPSTTSAPVFAEADARSIVRSHQTVEKPALSHEGETAHSQAAEPIVLDPLSIHSPRELEDLCTEMVAYFEGKETEHNWLPRDKSVTKLRRILKGNAPNEFHQSFMTCIKVLTDGIIRVATSLRTTVSTNACQLVQELAAMLGPALDPQVDLFLQFCIKMSASTKHISAENGRATASAIFQNCSYHLRWMQHIWTSAQDKSAATRQCVPEWLTIILKRQASYKQHFDTSGGLALAEKCIKRGLDDANPKVKERTRATYWTMAKTWPDRAEGIMSKLDAKSKTALEKDAHNPHAALHGSVTISSSTSLRSAGTSSRSALREVMAEQRRAKTGLMAGRPNSAMANLSPAKARSDANLRTTARQQSNLSQSAGHGPSRPAHESHSPASSKRSALMSGPVRRPRRPEIQRPQTADPYAARRLLRPETPASTTSIEDSPPKINVQQSPPAIAHAATRNHHIHQSQLAAERSLGSPSSSIPVNDRQISSNLSYDSRPSSKHSDRGLEGDFTSTSSSRRDGGEGRRTVQLSAHKRSGHTVSVDEGIRRAVDQDKHAGETSIKSSNRMSLAYQSPLKAMFEEAREKLEKTQSPPRDANALNMLDTSLLVRSQRPESPAKSPMPQIADVQIYEDPFVVDTAEVSSDGQRKVLGELPVNENIALPSPLRNDNASGRPGSPRRPFEGVAARELDPAQDRAELLRNRKLLSSGIDRIRDCNLDAHGFRRVQDLVKNRGDIWEDGRHFDDLMGVVLDYLQSFEVDARLRGLPESKSQGIKVQALGLVRALLTVHRKRATPWYSRVLITVLICRDAVEKSNCSLVDVTRLGDEVVKQSPTNATVETLLDYLSNVVGTHPSTTGKQWRSIAMALVMLRQCLVRHSPAPTSSVKVRLTQMAARYLDAEDAEVRKADVELASELFELFGSSKTEFWAEFRGTDEGRLGLLTYYIARKARAN